MHYVQGVSRSQQTMFVETLDELIGQDDPVRVIDLYISGLDPAKLGFSHARLASKGRPPYHPLDMLRLYLYGYLHRVRSSRRLEAECRRNVEVMWLLGKLVPDHKTIANFRRTEAQAIQAVCCAFVQFCRQAGLVGGKLVAIDGTKVQAVASARRARFSQDIKREREAVQARIATYLNELDQADTHDTEPLCRQGVPQALEALYAKRVALDESLKTLSEAGDSHLIEGEPDARIMRTSHGSRIAAYNLQSAVDDEHKLIIHHELCTDAADNRQLLPIARAAKQVLRQESLSVVADKGYSNGEQFTQCEALKIIPYVPVNRAVNNQADGQLFERSAFVYDPDSDTYRCPADQILVRKQIHRTGRSVIYAGVACGQCQIKHRCTTGERRFVQRHMDEDSLNAAQARITRDPEMMRRRAGAVEHPFGTLKRWILGDGRFLLRGRSGACTEIALAVLAYNVKRALNILGIEQMKRLLAS